MQPISRRSALLLGGVGAASVFVGATGLITGSSSNPVAATGGKFSEPQALRSVNGKLHAKLTAAASPARIGGRNATALTYNGGLPGPTLFLRPGDVLRVTLDNQLRDTTNLHVHGLHVSPEGNSDNVFLAVEPGTTFDYEYRLPLRHPPGVYWYHPHHHGTVAEQVFGGLYGAIIVEDPEEVPALRERVLVISDITVNSSGQIPDVSPMDRMVGREGEMILVNGHVGPLLSPETSGPERWRVINACASRYLNLHLEGHVIQLLGIDSGRFTAPQDVEEVMLAPGNRADLLVTLAAGRSVLRTLPFDRGGAGMMGRGTASSRETDILILDVNGSTSTSMPPPATGQAPPRDLRNESVTRRREITFEMGMGMGAGMMSLTVDGKPFDPSRIDTVVNAGAIEEWTLTNTSPMDHPIHLHVWPMQVMDPSGGSADQPQWQDVVNVPAFSSVTVRIPFEGFTGKTVYHCHILDHEDAGMMGIIEVQ